jgi:hypothetical protein
MAGERAQQAGNDPLINVEKDPNFDGFVVPDMQQTSYQGGSQKANQYVREAMRLKRQSCTATGGFNKGQGDNHECLYGEDAVAHIEGIGENAPAYERAQEWLAEYNAEPGLDEDTTADDTTENIEQQEAEASEENAMQAALDGDWESVIGAFPTAEEASDWLASNYEKLKDALGNLVSQTITPDDYAECQGTGNGGYNTQGECIVAKTRAQIIIPGLPPIPLPGVKLEVIKETAEEALESVKEVLESAGDAAAGAWDWVKGAVDDGIIDVSSVLSSVAAGDYTFGGLFSGSGGESTASEGLPLDTTEQIQETVDVSEDGLTFGGLPGESTVASQDVGETPDLVIPGGVTETTTNSGMLTGANENLTFGGGSSITEQDINGLYLNLLGRDAKQSGLDYWMGDVERGATLDDIEFNIKQSEEYKNLSGGLGFGHEGGSKGSVVTTGTNVLDLSGNGGNVEEVVATGDGVVVNEDAVVKDVVVDGVVVNEDAEVEDAVVKDVVVDGVVVNEDAEVKDVVVDGVVVNEDAEVEEPFIDLDLLPELTKEEEEEETILTGGGDDSLFSGSLLSGAGAAGFSPFMAGITYTPLEVQDVIQSPQTNYVAELDKIINRSMFKGMIG